MNRLYLLVVLIFLFQSAVSNNGDGDLPKKHIVQSPLYDALSVHFANMGYWVYFIQKDPVDNRREDTESKPAYNSFGDPQNPGRIAGETFIAGEATNSSARTFENPTESIPDYEQPGDSDPTASNEKGRQIYRIEIYNSLNGEVIEILSQNIDSIYKHLNTYYFDQDGDTTKQIIEEVFLRNASLDPGLETDSIIEAYRSNQYWDNAFLNHPPVGSRKAREDISKLITLDTRNLPKDGGAFPGAQIFAEGLADFLIMRVSEEMDLLFISQLKNAFKKHEEIQLLFPETYDYIKDRSVEDFYLALAKFKDATRTDISNIIYNISTLGNLEKLKPVFNENPELSVLFTVFNLAGLLQQEKSPAYIIHDIYTSQYLYHNTDMTYNPASFIKLTGMISDALLNLRKGSNMETSSWISNDELKILSNETIFQIYNCLIFQGFPDIIFKSADGKNISIKNIYSQIDLLNILTKLRETGETINSKLNKIEQLKEEKQEGKIDIEVLKNYVSIIHEIMNASYKVGESLAIEDDRFKDILNDLNFINNYITPIITNTATTAQHIQLQEYSLAVQEGFVVIDTLLSLIQDQIDKKDSSSDHYKKLKRSFTVSREVILRYGSFIASVAVAETSEEVTTAIKTFSLPAGSHRIKKKSAFSVGLNAYLGYYHGYNLDTSIRSNGVTAPLGLSINTGFGNAGGLSLTGYILDVGAIINSKTDSSDISTNEITWGNLFSPGISIGYNLPIWKDYSLPFTIGGSMQWGPELKGEYSAGSIFENKVLTFRIFFVFDIPITNFYVSSIRRK